MVRITTRLIFLLLLIIISGQVNAQRLRATASLDSSQILIGDQVKLTLEIEYPDNIKIEFPQVPDTIQNLIEVLGRSPVDTLEIESENLQKLIQIITITSFDSGSYQIPPFWFTFDMNGLIDSISSNSVALHVVSMEVDTTMGPTDIKMPYGAPVTLKEVIPHILGIILLGAILFFVFYLIKGKKNNKPFLIAQKPKEPAHITAIRELERIKEEKLWQKNEIKQYYSEITEVLRNYMENRFQIPAMEQTTDEIIQIFINRTDLLNEKSFSNLKQILSLSDLVKFAKYKPSTDDDNMTLINSFFFVNDTKLEKVGKVPEDVNSTDNGELLLNN